jgi:hypothetical protein
MTLYLHGVIKEDHINKVYATRSHQYALYYWSRAFYEKIIKPNALLIHVDLHSDYLSPRCNIDQSASPESIHKLIQNKSIAYDEFIKPAIQFGIVKTVAFCCNPKQRNVYGNFNNYGSPIKIVEMLLDHNNHQALHKAEHNICNN